jgi:hypothetical protein
MDHLLLKILAQDGGKFLAQLGVLGLIISFSFFVSKNFVSLMGGKKAKLCTYVKHMYDWLLLPYLCSL